MEQRNHLNRCKRLGCLCVFIGFAICVIGFLFSESRGMDFGLLVCVIGAMYLEMARLWAAILDQSATSAEDKS